MDDQQRMSEADKENSGDEFKNSTLSKNGLDRFYYWPESFLQIQ